MLHKNEAHLVNNLSKQILHLSKLISYTLYKTHNSLHINQLLCYVRIVYTCHLYIIVTKRFMLLVYCVFLLFLSVYYISKNYPVKKS